MAANKNDMYEHEEIEENEGRTLAERFNALFQKTSAKENTGIKELFEKIGKKFLNQNTCFMTKEEIKKKRNLLKIVKIKKKKKYC